MVRRCSKPRWIVNRLALNKINVHVNSAIVVCGRKYLHRYGDSLKKEMANRADVKDARTYLLN